MTRSGPAAVERGIDGAGGIPSARPVTSVLALDIATNTGWASHVNGRVASGVLNLPTIDYGEMGARFSAWLADRIHEGVDLLVIERPTFSRITDSSYRCDGLCFLAHQTAYLHEVERREVRPKEWRKAVYDDGGMSTREAKRHAMEWARARGFDPKTHDEAEALAILTYAMERWT
jgi:hypothetical protein